MRIEILEKAEDDLFEGYLFYETQETGLGTSFWRVFIQTSNRCAFMQEFTG